jgi:ABC-type Na+ efflux pump permease subunit
MKTVNALDIRAALRVARKDIRILLKERGTLLYLFVVPIVFIVGLSATTGVQREPKQAAITLPVVNLDAGSEASLALLDALNQGGGIRCELYDEAQAAALLEREKIERVLTIPANYATGLKSGQPVTLRLVNGPDASATKSEAVHRVVTGVAADLSLQTQLIASFRQMADMQARHPQTSRRLRQRSLSNRPRASSSAPERSRCLALGRAGRNTCWKRTRTRSIPSV